MNDCCLGITVCHYSVIYSMAKRVDDETEQFSMVQCTHPINCSVNDATIWCVEPMEILHSLVFCWNALNWFIFVKLISPEPPQFYNSIWWPCFVDSIDRDISSKCYVIKIGPAKWINNCMITYYTLWFLDLLFLILLSLHRCCCCQTHKQWRECSNEPRIEKKLFLTKIM